MTSLNQGPTVRRVAFPRRRRTGIAGLLGLDQVLLLGIAGVYAMFTALIGGAGHVLQAIPFLLFVAIIAAWPRSPIKGRPLLHFIILRGVFMARKVRGQTSFRAPIVAAPAVGEFRLPGGLRNVKLVDGGSTLGAITVNPADQTFSAVVRVSAPGWALQSGEDKSMRLGAYSNLLSSLTNHKGLARIQIMLSAIVTSPTAVSDYSRQHRIELPSSWAQAQYDTLLETRVSNSAQHQTHLVIVMSRREVAKQVMEAGGGYSGMMALMAQEVGAMSHALEDCNLLMEEWLGPRALSALIRQAYDPVSTPDVDGRIGEFAGVAPENAGPRGAEESWEYFRTDSGFHTTFEVTDWPRIYVDPDFLNKIVDLPYRHTFSIIATPVTLEASLSAIERDRTRIAADRSMRQRLGSGKQESVWVGTELEDLNAREQEVVAGFGDLEFAGLVTITAPDLASLRVARTALEQAAAQSMIEVRPFYGQQSSAFNAAALPLGITTTTPRNSWMGGLF